MRTAKVAHLLTTDIKGANLLVHVGVDAAAEGSESETSGGLPSHFQSGVVQSGALGQAPISRHAWLAAWFHKNTGMWVDSNMQRIMHCRESKNFSATPLNAWW
jgi:hypothetical protein